MKIFHYGATKRLDSIDRPESAYFKVKIPQTRRYLIKMFNLVGIPIAIYT